MPIDDPKIDDRDFIPIECGVGDVVFMSYFMVHRSSPKGDHRLRLSCSTRFDNCDNPFFIKRSYQSAYRRTVDRSLILDRALSEANILKSFADQEKKK